MELNKTVNNTLLIIIYLQVSIITTLDKSLKIQITKHLIIIDKSVFILLGERKKPLHGPWTSANYFISRCNQHKSFY